MNASIDISEVTLHTPRMTLRPWRESDLEDFYAYAKVDGVGQMAGWTPHKNMEESRTILQKFIVLKRTFALEYGAKSSALWASRNITKNTIRSLPGSGAGSWAMYSPGTTGAVG